jgi:hypothetical protein
LQAFQENYQAWFAIEHNLREIAKGFEEINGLPNVVGAIDGCLIKLQRPADITKTGIAGKVLLLSICNA